MCDVRIALFLVILFSSQLFSLESEISPSQSQLVIQSSKYIKFNSSNLITLNGALTFDGKFIVLGEGIYGHFDLVVFNDSGTVVYQTKSVDRAYRRHRGVKLKSVKMNLENVSKYTKAEVTFHEMRVDPKAGTCILKP